MITLPKKCYISFITKDYLYLANKLIQSVKLFSNFPLVIYTYNFDHDFGIENIYSVRINDESIQKPLFVHSTEENLGIVDRFDFNTFYNLTRKFEVVLQSLNNGISDGIFLDCDVIVNNNIDELFNNFDKIENYPLISKGIFEYMILNGKGDPFDGQDVLEKPLMDLLNVKDRSMHYVQTNMMLFNEKCRDFFEECKKITFDINIIKDSVTFAPFQDETIINVLLWKYQAKNQLPLQYFNLIDENQLKYFFETNCENSYYNGCWWHYFPANKSDVKYFHGCKNEKILSECINFLKNKFKKKKIAFVTLFDGNYQELAKYSIPNKIAYAKKNNYDFYYFDSIIDSSKPPQWNKILAIQKILEKGVYDWVWWIDIDSLILNFDIKLESIIDENYEIIFTQNTYSYISSGSCFFKNTDLVKNFLADVYYLRKDYLKDLKINIFDHEQQAIRLILQNDQTYKNITKLIHERVCNAYCPTYNPDVLRYYPNWNNDDNLYQPNDFLIQFCGRNMEERINDFLKYLMPKKIALIISSDNQKIINRQLKSVEGSSFEFEFYFSKKNNPQGFISFSQMINESICNTKSEYMIFVNPKVLLNIEDIQFIVKELISGKCFASIIGLGLFGATKSLFKEIGMMDERFLGGEYEDNDFALRLKIFNKAVYAKLDFSKYLFESAPSKYDPIRGCSLSIFCDKWNPTNDSKYVISEKNLMNKKLPSHIVTDDNIKYSWLDFDKSYIDGNYNIFNNLKTSSIKIIALDKKRTLSDVTLIFKFNKNNLYIEFLSSNNEFITAHINDITNAEVHHCICNNFISSNNWWGMELKKDRLHELKIFIQGKLLYNTILLNDIENIIRYKLYSYIY